jgi:hypothetical protein
MPDPEDQSHFAHHQVQTRAGKGRAEGWYFTGSLIETGHADQLKQHHVALFLVRVV